jgi:hypothetical protein
MHADYSPAFRTPPSILLPRCKTLQPELLDALEILDRAHAVFRPVAFVQLSLSQAGETGALEAEFLFAHSHLGAIFKPAYLDVLYLARIVAVAARAAILRSEMGDAHPAVDPAWRNQLCVERLRVLFLYAVHAPSTIMIHPAHFRRYPPGRMATPD